MANALHGGVYAKFPGGPAAYRAASLDETLDELFEIAVGHAEDRIRWYDTKGSSQGRTARGLRIAAILMFAIGTIIPILMSVIVKLGALYGTGKPAHSDWQPIDFVASWPYAEVGYVLLAVAGAIIVFDQFFDASGSWMRFRQSQAHLEVLLAELRFTWANEMLRCGGTITTADQASTFTGLLKDFVMKVELTAEAETKEWAERFRARLDAFDRNPDLKVRIGGADDGGGTSPAPSPSSAAPQAPATPAVAPPASGPAAVTLRLAVADAGQIEALSFSVDGAPVAVPADGHVELPLAADVQHLLVAVGRRAGKSVRGTLDIRPGLDDEGKPIALTLI